MCLCMGNLFSQYLVIHVIGDSDFVSKLFNCISRRKRFTAYRQLARCSGDIWGKMCGLFFHLVLCLRYEKHFPLMTMKGSTLQDKWKGLKQLSVLNIFGEVDDTFWKIVLEKGKIHILSCFPFIPQIVKELLLHLNLRFSVFSKKYKLN